MDLEIDLSPELSARVTRLVSRGKIVLLSRTATTEWRLSGWTTRGLEIAFDLGHELHAADPRVIVQIATPPAAEPDFPVTSLSEFLASLAKT